MHWKRAQKGRKKLRRSLTSRQFEQFVATERGMLVRLAMNILHHPEDADDAMLVAACNLAWRFGMETTCLLYTSDAADD